MASNFLLRTSYWFFLIFLPFFGLSQAGQPPLQPEPIFSDMVFYWDEAGSKNLEEIEALYKMGEFYKPDSTSYIQEGQKATNPGVYWAVYQLIPDSAMKSSEEFGFCVLGELTYFWQRFDIIDIHYKTDHDSLISIRTGRIANTYKKAKRWQFSNSCVPIRQVNNRDSVLIFIRFFDAGKYRKKFFGYQTLLTDEKNRVNQRIIARGPTIIFRIIFIGILFYFSLYSFIQYWQIRERAYLYYAFYLIVTFFYTAEHLEWDSEVYGIFSHITEWHFHFEVPLIALIYLFYMSFVNSFLDLSKENKNASRLLRAGMVVTIILLLVDIVARQIGGTYLSMLCYKYDRYPLFIMAVPYFYELYKTNKERQNDPDYKEKRKLVMYIVTGSMFIVIGGLLTLLLKKLPFIDHESGQFFRHSLTYTQLGLLAENTIFIIGLGYKTRLNALLLQQRVASQTEKIHLLEDKTTRLKVDAHTMKNILQAIQSLVKTKPNEASRYLVQAAQLCEKWYEEAVHEKDDKYHPLKEEIGDMETWVVLNNMLLDPKIQLQTTGKEGLDETFPKVVKRLLLPFVENAIIHGLTPKKETPRILNLLIDWTEDAYKIVIEDNGIGRKAANDLVRKHSPGKESTGIQISQELMESNEISFHIEDLIEEDKAVGTRVTIKIPT